MSDIEQLKTRIAYLEEAVHMLLSLVPEYAPIDILDFKCHFETNLHRSDRAERIKCIHGRENRRWTCRCIGCIAYRRVVGPTPEPTDWRHNHHGLEIKKRD